MTEAARTHTSAPRGDPARQPNLFVVGAMKCGTSSLHAYLGAHPSIFMSDPKEPSYFVDSELLEHIVCANEEQYLALFRRAGEAKVIGESSTNYSKLPHFPGVAHRIREFNREARIVYIMRDPIERTISHYWHRVRRHAETLPMLQAVQRNPHYCAVSHYAMQIAPYVDLFGREQVFALTLEQLAATSGESMRALYRWLDVDAEFVPANLSTRLHQTESVVPQARGRGWLQRLRRSGRLAGVAPWMPPSIRAFGRGLSEREVDRTRVPTTETVGYLRPLQRAETLELGALLGREFSEWTTLWGASDT